MSALQQLLPHECWATHCEADMASCLVGHQDLLRDAKCAQAVRALASCTKGAWDLLGPMVIAPNPNPHPHPHPHPNPNPYPNPNPSPNQAHGPRGTPRAPQLPPLAQRPQLPSPLQRAQRGTTPLRGLALTRGQIADTSDSPLNAPRLRRSRRRAAS